jgi:hypothetical protein
VIPASVYVKLDGEDVPVARGSVDLKDGGVFLVHEFDWKKKGAVTHHRVGSLPPEALAKLKAHHAVRRDRKAAA